MFGEVALTGNGGSGIHSDFPKLIELFNEMYERTTKTKKEEKYRLPFRGVKSTPWFKNLTDLLIPYPGRKWEEMPAYDRSTVPESEVAWSDWIIAHISQINGFTSANNTWLLLRFMYPETFIECPVVKHFAYYLSVASKNWTEEPFIEQGSGNFVNKTNDSSFALRMKLAINCTMEYLRPNQPVDKDVIFELYEYMFKNLGEGVLNIKNFKYPFLVTWFCGSTSGQCLQWDENIEVATAFDKSNKNTFYVLHSMEESIKEQSEKMDKAGLTKFKQFLTSMQYAKVTPRAQAAGSMTVFIEAMFGYLRDNFAEVISNQIDESEKLMVDNPEGYTNAGFGRIYVDLIKKFFSEVTWRSEEDFHAAAASHMTTRSAGFNSKGSVDPSVTGVEVTEEIPEFEFEYQGSKIIYRGSDKVTWYIMNPKARHDNMSNVGLEEEGVFSGSRPGKVGLRSVPARKERAIFMGKGETQLVESLVANDLEEFSATRMLHEHGNPRDPANGITTTSRDTGAAFTDHRRWVHASSQMSDDKIVVEQDFSSLDQTSKYGNTRRYWIQALEELYESGGVTTPMINGKRSHRHLIDFWKRTKGATFLLPNGPNRITDYVVLRTDMLLSGEYLTRYYNDMTTFAFFLYCEENMREMNSHWTIREVKIQGDDVIEVRDVSHAFQTMSQEKKVAFVQAYRDRRSELAKLCGLKINPLKFVVSPIMFEFLKKMMVLGVFWPRYMQAGVGQNESERVDRSVDPISRMISRIGQAREYLFRGGPFLETMLRIYHEWNLVRRVNMSKRGRAVIPYAVLFAPLGHRGVGMIPWTIVDPNVDVLLRKMNWDTRTHLILDAWTLANELPKVNTVRGKAKAAAEELTEAIAWISSNSNKKALDASMSSSKILEENYKYKDPVPYYARAAPMIRQTFQDAPQMNADRVKDKKKNTNIVMEALPDLMIRLAKGEVSVEPHPLEGVTFIPGELEGDKTGMTYIAGLDYVVDMWTREMGPSGRGNASTLDLFRTLKKLLNKSSIPNNLSENMADSLARTIIENKFTDSTSIYHLFMSRGAGDYPKLADQVAHAIGEQVRQIRFIADISNFSLIGEGFTDKTPQRIFRSITVSEPFSVMSRTESDIVYTLGFQSMRNQPLLMMKDGELVYRPRRKVHVDVPDSVTRQWLIGVYGMKPETAFYNYRDPTLTSDLV
jgi:hypothetical protein